MFTVLNNVGVVSVGHGTEPPGVSHWPDGPVPRLGPGEERLDTERSFLSHILLKRRAGLAFPWAFTLPGRLCSLSSMLGNSPSNRLWLACSVVLQLQWRIQQGHRQSVYQIVNVSTMDLLISPSLITGQVQKDKYIENKRVGCWCNRSGKQKYPKK